MNKRNLEYEKRIRAYLFKGDIKRFKEICKEIGIMNNLNCLKEIVNFKIDLKGGLK